MKKILLYLLINIISVLDLLFLSKAFEYEKNNINVSNRDNMAWILFWPILFYIIVIIVIILNLLLGITGVVYFQKINIMIKDFIYTNNNNLITKIIKIIGYSYLSLYFIFFIKALSNTNYYGLLFNIFAIINTVLYIIWIVAVFK